MTLIADAPTAPDWTAAAARVRSLRGGLLFRLSLFNLGALALLGAAFGEGWGQMVFAADSTGLTWVIAAVFALGLALSFVKARRVAGEIDLAEKGRAGPGSWTGDYRASTAGRGAGARSISATALKARVAAAILPVRHVAGSLVILGLIGTVLGFIMALSGVSAGAATDVSQVGAMVTRLIAGMSVALYTTLEGAVLSLWLTVNHQILAAAAGRFVVRLVQEGEADARD